VTRSRGGELELWLGAVAGSCGWSCGWELWLRASFMTHCSLFQRRVPCSYYREASIDRITSLARYAKHISPRMAKKS